VYPKVTLESAWTGSVLSKNPEVWIYTLTPADKRSIHEAVLHFQSLNKSMEAMVKTDFPFSVDFVREIENWKSQLSPAGRGFQLIRGVPVREWSLTQSEIFFWAFGKYLGLPGAQDAKGALLHHVLDSGINATEGGRRYRTKGIITYHGDGADIVGLLCLHPAKIGGSSRIISSVTVYNKLLDHVKGQAYVHRLFERVLFFTGKKFGGSALFNMNPIRLDSAGVLRTYWNQDNFLRAYRLPNGTLTDAGKSDAFAMEAIEAYDDILNKDLHRGNFGSEGKSEKNESEELGLDMVLQQGDIQLCSNHLILHSRTEFEDFTDEEIAAGGGNPSISSDKKHGPIGRRDLLRLWVSTVDNNMSWGAFIEKQIDLVGLLFSHVEGMVRYR